MKKIIQVMSDGTRNVIEDTDINCYRRKVILNGLKNEDMRTKIMNLYDSEDISSDQRNLISDLINVDEIIDIDEEMDNDIISIHPVE
jgi:hypothetical protein|tara:strand:- start:548 stop:808 length:261 start_codon:yes stop_codon:yes gene_type:complete